MRKLFAAQAALFRKTREPAHILKSWLDAIYNAKLTKYKNAVYLPLQTHGIENIGNNMAEAIVRDNYKKRWLITIKRLD